MATKNIRRETKKAADTYDDDIDKLWKILATASPEDTKKIISRLGEAEMLALRTRKNPYKLKSSVYQNHNSKILAFNIINLRKEYLRRLSMTSLIGFTFRMCDEWMPTEVDGKYSDDYISQNDSKFAKFFNEKSEALKRTRPIEISRQRIAGLNARIANTEDKVESKKLHRELLLEQVRLSKYSLFFANKEKESTKTQLDIEAVELDRTKAVNTSEQKRVKTITKKLELRVEFEGSDSHNALLAYYKKNPGAPLPDYDDDYLEDIKKVKLSKFDKLGSVDDLKMRLENKQSNLVIIEKQIVKVQNKIDEIKAYYDELTEKSTYYSAQIREIKATYDKHFKSERKHPFDSIVIKEYELDDDEYDTVISETKEILGIKKTREEWHEKQQNIVNSFLTEYFVYNPDNHVQCSYAPNYDDKFRTPLKEAWIKKASDSISEERYNTILEKHKEDVNKMRVVAETSYERSLIPPDDTFFRWKRYEENNYEEIRQATDDIYSEKSDLEYTIVPLEVFEGSDMDELKVQYEIWQRKYSEEFEGDVFQATFGVHNFLAPWEQNREKREFYTKKSEILKRIIDQSEKDAKIGQRLNKQRAEKGKKRNEQKEGPHDPALANVAGNELLREGGAKPLSEMDDIFTTEKLQKSNNPEESTKDEIEVGFVNIRPQRRRKGGRRKNAGTTEVGKFHIPTEKPLPGSATVMKPTDLHKKMAEDDLKSLINDSKN